MKNKKLKQIISTVIIATTVASTIPTVINPTAAFASSDVTYSTELEAQNAGFHIRLKSDDTYEIVYFVGSENVTIPSQINGKSVTSIGDTAFEESELVSIRIPNSVTSIGRQAFSNCVRLASITIPSNVTSIGDGAFAGCSGLTSITIPSSVTRINYATFAGCSGLVSIGIPSSVTSIDSNAFNYINTNAIFYAASQSVANLIEPYRTGSIQTIILELTLESKTASTATVSFPAMAGATSVKVQQSTDGGTNWSDAETEALDSTSTSATVTGLTAGTDYKFRLVMNDDFSGNPLDVTTDAGSSTYTSSQATADGFRFQLINNGTEYQITGYVGTNTTVTIPSQIDGKSVTSIGPSAFNSCSSLTSITIPSSVTSIEGYAFAGCSGLTSIEIPSSVTSIGEAAFGGCSGLTSIEIQNGVTSIGEAAFRDCSGLTSITIPNSVTSIGYAAFVYCSRLTSIEIPSSVTSIGSAAFALINNNAIFYVPNLRTAELVKPYLAGTHIQIIINSNLALDTKTAETATLSFGAQTGATSVKIQQSSDGGTTWRDAATEVLTAASTGATITGLTAGTDYKFRLVMNNSFYGNPLDVTTEAGTAVTPANTVAAVAANSAPMAGTYSQVTLTVKDSSGNTDITFNGSKNVTVSGYTAAPDGSYGILNYNTQITQPSTTISLNFLNGVATLDLRLTNAASQNIAFNVDGVDNSNAISITPVPAVAAREILTQDIEAPSSNGGRFAKQPIVTIKDLYGNICTNDNTTEMFASKGDRGSWTLTGTTRVTVRNGIATFNDLGATNDAAVTGAQLAFSFDEGIIHSRTVNLPAPGAANEISSQDVEQLGDIRVENGTDRTDLELPQNVYVTLSDSSIISAAVTWNNGNPAYDGNTAGTYVFKGRLGLPEGITNPADLTASVDVIVGQIDDQETTSAAVKVESVESLSDIVVKNGTAREEIDLPDTVNITLSNSTTASAQVRWEDVSPEYSGYKARTYVFKGRLILPEGVINPYDYTAKVNVRVKASKSNNSSTSSSSNSSSSTEQVTVRITDGSSDKSVSQAVINRTTARDGSKTDVVKYTADKAQETIKALAKEGKDTARIVATDSDVSVSQTQVNIPKDTLSALSRGKVNLEIQANGAIVSVPKESVQGLAQSGQLNEDLYFRVIPIKDGTRQVAIKTTADKEAAVKAAVGSTGVQVLGTPMTIETNMGQRPVEIILPLTGANLPTDQVQRQAFLNDLGVFIEHSDGEKVFEKGIVVDYGNGVLGIKFRTTKFSDFTIVKLNQTTKAGWKLTNGSWYFINNNGIMATGWYKDTDGSWYYLCEGKGYETLGAMETGWKYIDGSWYFLKDNGVMATGWQKSDGKWYYLYNNGSMASNTTIDGYKIGESGTWIE